MDLKCICRLVLSPARIKKLEMLIGKTAQRLAGRQQLTSLTKSTMSTWTTWQRSPGSSCFAEVCASMARNAGKFVAIHLTTAIQGLNLRPRPCPLRSEKERGRDQIIDRLTVLKWRCVPFSEPTWNILYTSLHPQRAETWPDEALLQDWAGMRANRFVGLGPWMVLDALQRNVDPAWNLKLHTLKDTKALSMSLCSDHLHYTTSLKSFVIAVACCV